MVEINQVFAIDFDCRGPFNPIAGEGFAGPAVRTLRLSRYGVTQILFQRLFPFIFEKEIELWARLENRAVNHVEPWIIKQPGFADLREVCRDCEISAMVVAIIATGLTLRKF